MKEILSYCERQIALWYVRAYGEEKSAQKIKKRANIERALSSVGDDIAGENERKKLQRALILNCTDRKNFPFYRLGVDFISERDFYRRRDRFLSDVLTAAQGV